MENKNYFAINLKFLRSIKNYTLNDVSQKINKSCPLISRWEKGEREPSLDDCILVANLFGVPISDLLTEDLRFTSDNVEVITPEEFVNEVKKMLDRTNDMDEKDKEHIKNTLDYICREE